MTRKHKRYIAKWLMRRPFVRSILNGCPHCGMAARGAILRLIIDRMSCEKWLIFPEPEDA